ncbi:MAG: hypothetical protein NXI14_00320 [bacterium]|nr:hypothetical protein [bacterium]
MGTSQSSTGSPSGVPMVPPWVDGSDGEIPPQAESPSEDIDDSDEAIDKPHQPEQLAPKARFYSTRIALGKFAETGDRAPMQRGVGRYIGAGLGGTQTAVRRFGGTATGASALYSALGGTSSDRDTKLDRNVLAGRTANQIIAAVVEATRPVDGSLDSEASRQSINDALSDLLKRYPDTDLLKLTEEQRVFVVERYVAYDVYLRFMLDVGQHIQDKSPTRSIALSRQRQIREYIREAVAASFRTMRNAGRTLTGGNVSSLVRSALESAFDVFVGFSE